MKKVIVGFLLLFAFVIGCGASIIAQDYVFAPAVAQDLKRWDYNCFPSNYKLEEFTENLKVYGEDGWEIAYANESILCFKRPM